MDKTQVFRLLCTRIVIACVSAQAMTPDALDLTLVEYGRPPAPILVLSDLCADDEEDAGDMLTPFAATGPRLPFDEAHASEEPIDNIWLPRWPELGLHRCLKKSLHIAPRIDHFHDGSRIEQLQGCLMGRRGVDEFTGMSLSSLLCRILC
jgi:hypothetical protein